MFAGVLVMDHGAPGVINQSLPSGSALNTNAAWGLANDGTYSISTGLTGNWVSPASTTLAAFYQVKVDLTAGEFDGGPPTGEWLDLSTNRSWALSYLEVSNQVTFNVSIREKATGVVRSVQNGLTLEVIHLEL